MKKTKTRIKIVKLYTHQFFDFLFLFFFDFFTFLFPSLCSLACASALKAGWVPILLSLGISQFAGMALESSIVSYQGVGIFVLFINGFGGNMVVLVLCIVILGDFLNKALAMVFKVLLDSIFGML